MSVKVAINGFGRIGRLAFRQMFGAELMRIHLKFPFQVSEFSILRKEKAANPIKKA